MESQVGFLKAGREIREKSESKDLHVLIIPSWYKTPELPVYGSFFEEQARGLMKKGHKVGILFPEFAAFSDDKYPFKEKYLDDGLLTYHILFKARIPRWRAFNYKDFGNKVWVFFKDYVSVMGRPDIIHAHTVFFGGIIANYIHQKTGIPFVLTEHYTPFITGGIRNRKDLSIARKVFQKAGQTNVVSKSFQKDLAEKMRLPDETFHVLHNMVNPLFFHENSHRTLTNDSKIRLFTNSYLLPRKNHQLMLKAFRLLVNDYPEAELVIGGEGPSQDELVRLSTSLGLSENVIFRGLLNREEVHEELNKCHIFLLSSLYETFGVVLIEALAVGRPVITTDCGGPRDIVTKENGVILNSFHAEEMAGEIKRTIKNYDQYDQDKISEDCRIRFGEDKILSQIEESYKSVLKH